MNQSITTNDEINSMQSFPFKLYSIINNIENSSVISWSLSGDLFTINSPHEFREKILSNNNSLSTNYSSFVRQLNMYEFKKIKNKLQEKSDTYWHKFFLQGKPHLLKNIRRKSNLTSKKTQNTKEKNDLKLEIGEYAKNNYSNQNNDKTSKQIIHNIYSSFLSNVKFIYNICLDAFR